MGEAIKVQNGYTACSHPNMMSPSVKLHDSGVTLKGEPILISNGKTGIRIPNPSRSIKTVMKIAKRGLRRIR
jgi:hypothetical protein